MQVVTVILFHTEKSRVFLYKSFEIQGNFFLMYLFFVDSITFLYLVM